MNPARPREGGGARRGAVVLVGALLFSGFMALGVWQLQRLAWKLDLIARVDARVHAPALAPPGPQAWPRVTAKDDEYRHVRVSGTFDNARETLVQALTEAGPGFWVMTPFRADSGGVILVNRGFVPQERSAQGSRSAGLITARTTVTGLLRMSEPHGGFLRANQPAAQRWYSRDVAEIARGRGVAPVAPYFIDADARPNLGGWPRGGLTVIRFPNSHLVYALTWFGLAGMVVAWGVWPAVQARSRRSGVARAPTHGPQS